jgi:hypothetical protein
MKTGPAPDPASAPVARPASTISADLLAAAARVVEHASRHAAPRAELVPAAAAATDMTDQAGS